MYIAVCWGMACTKLCLLGVRYVHICLLGYGMYKVMFAGVQYVYSCVCWGYGMYIAMFVGVQYVHGCVCWGTVCT